MFLGRYPDEPTDATVAGFYRTLLDVLADPTFHDGRWQLAESSGWPGSAAENLAAWCWDGGTRWLIVVNLGNRPAAGLVRAPLTDLLDRRWQLTDPTHTVSYDRSGNDLLGGLFVELAAWDWHLWRIDQGRDDTTSDEPGTTGGDG